MDLQASAYAVTDLSGHSHGSLQTLVDRYTSRFSRVLIVPGLLGFSSYWVNEKMVGGNGVLRSAPLRARTRDTGQETNREL